VDELGIHREVVLDIMALAIGADVVKLLIEAHLVDEGSRVLGCPSVDNIVVVPRVVLTSVRLNILLEEGEDGETVVDEAVVEVKPLLIAKGLNRISDLVALSIIDHLVLRSEARGAAGTEGLRVLTNEVVDEAIHTRTREDRRMKRERMAHVVVVNRVRILDDLTRSTLKVVSGIRIGVNHAVTIGPATESVVDRLVRRVDTRSGHVVLG